MLSHYAYTTLKKTQFKYIMLCCLKSEFECITIFRSIFTSGVLLFFTFTSCQELLSSLPGSECSCTPTLLSAILKSAPVPLLLSPPHKTKQHSHFPTTPDSPKALPRSRTHTGVRTYSPPARQHELPNQF